MAKFNPLKFSIEIVDNIDAQLNNIKSKISNAFDKVPLRFTMGNGNIEELRKQLQGIMQGLDMGKLQMPDMSKAASESSKVAEGMNSAVASSEKLLALSRELESAQKAYNEALEKQKNIQSDLKKENTYKKYILAR